MTAFFIWELCNKGNELVTYSVVNKWRWKGNIPLSQCILCFTTVKKAAILIGGHVWGGGLHKASVPRVTNFSNLFNSWWDMYVSKQISCTRVFLSDTQSDFGDQSCLVWIHLHCWWEDDSVSQFGGKDGPPGGLNTCHNANHDLNTA